MSKNLNWGLVGLGKITRSFAADLQLTSQNLYAVASRSLEKAESFVSEIGKGQAYGSYEELVSDSEVDIVYIGTPHNSHHQLAIKAMQAGKHVLCEKPLGVNRRQVDEMVTSAKENGVFLMEALWTRFNPSVAEVISRVRQGDIGNTNYVNVDFHFPAEINDEGRLFNPELAGGSILDIGIYPLFLAYVLKGIPNKMTINGKLHHTGVDSQMFANLEYDDGIAQVSSGLLSKSDMVAKIGGDKGSFFISETWHETDSYTWFNRETGKREVIYHPRNGKGFTYEIEECSRCISEGKLESDKWSWEDSLNLVGMMDEIRGELGVRYPFE